MCDQHGAGPIPASESPNNSAGLAAQRQQIPRFHVNGIRAAMKPVAASQLRQGLALSKTQRTLSPLIAAESSKQ